MIRLVCKVNVHCSFVFKCLNELLSTLLSFFLPLFPLNLAKKYEFCLGRKMYLSIYILQHSFPIRETKINKKYTARKKWQGRLADESRPDNASSPL